MKLSQQQSNLFIFHLINLLIETNAYIKPYAKGWRAVDSNHNPVMNISEEQFNLLCDLQIIEANLPIWILSVKQNPFKNFTEIKIKKNETI